MTAIPTEGQRTLADLLTYLRGRSDGRAVKFGSRPPELGWFYAASAVRYHLPSPYREPFRVTTALVPPYMRGWGDISLPAAVRDAEVLLALGLPAVLVALTGRVLCVPPVYALPEYPTRSAADVAAGGMPARRAVLAAFAVSREAGEAALDALSGGAPAGGR